MKLTTNDANKMSCSISLFKRNSLRALLSPARLVRMKQTAFLPLRSLIVALLAFTITITIHAQDWAKARLEAVSYTHLDVYKRQG